MNIIYYVNFNWYKSSSKKNLFKITYIFSRNIKVAKLRLQMTILRLDYLY